MPYGHQQFQVLASKISHNVCCLPLYKWTVPMKPEDGGDKVAELRQKNLLTLKTG
jgi:hypothetical protein